MKKNKITQANADGAIAWLSGLAKTTQMTDTFNYESDNQTASLHQVS